MVLGELQEDDARVASLAPATEAPRQSLTALGLTLAALSDELRETYSLDEAVKGVVVTEVVQGSVAAERGIRAGDVIVEVSQEEVASPADVIDKVRAVQDSERRSVLLMIQRGDDLRFVALRLDNS